MRRKRKNPVQPTVKDIRFFLSGMPAYEFSVRKIANGRYIVSADRAKLVNYAHSVLDSRYKVTRPKSIADWSRIVVEKKSESNPMRRKRKNPAREDRIREEYPRIRASLKKVLASKDPDAIIRHVDWAMSKFEEIGFPDQWHDWERAKEDAVFAKRMSHKNDFGWNPRRKKSRRKTRRNHAMLTKGHVRSGAVSSKTLATRRYSPVRAPYSKLHKAMMTSMSRGGSQYEALAALRGKRSGMSLSRNPKRRKKNKRGRK